MSLSEFDDAWDELLVELWKVLPGAIRFMVVVWAMFVVMLFGWVVLR